MASTTKSSVSAKSGSITKTPARKSVTKAEAKRQIAAVKEAKKVAEATEGRKALISIKPFEEITAFIPITGIAPLIQHRFDEKAMKMMLEAMQGKGTIKAERPPRDPQAEFEAAKYLLENGQPGHPVTAFKIATADATGLFDKSVTKKSIKTALFFHGHGADQLMPLEFEECIMREDHVKVGMNQTDLRYRPMFTEWSTTLAVTYLPHQIDLESVATLVNAAGLGGVGEWRPSSPNSSGGTFGRFKVDLEACGITTMKGNVI